MYQLLLLVVQWTNKQAGNFEVENFWQVLKVAGCRQQGQHLQKIFCWSMHVTK
jgi:hypothetical protein